jgi:hypothetical protein
MRRLTNDDFCRAVYAINNSSFNGLEQYETMPISKFLLLCEIHSEAIERLNA